MRSNQPSILVNFTFGLDKGNTQRNYIEEEIHMGKLGLFA